MELLSTDPDRPGIFAVGQLAWGVFALGQLATGVIAVGQVARGVIAIGQGAVGLVAIGQGALGVLYAGGMVAVGGRGFGFCLKMLPDLVVQRFERPPLPTAQPWSAFASGAVERGFLLAEIEGGRLTVEGTPVPIEPMTHVERQLAAAARQGHTHACLTVAVEERVVPADGGYRQAAPRQRAVVARSVQTWREAPPRIRLEGPLTGVGGLLLRALGMVALAVAWWILAGMSVAAIFATP
jgi:hypothetical protein